MLSISEFFDLQCIVWPEIADRFNKLTSCFKREIILPSGAKIKLIFNPERIRSSAAKVDPVSIKQRPCFLCSEHRPTNQIIHQGLIDIGYEILVNPYPILPYHLTIASLRHAPQSPSLEDMITAARRFPGFAFFFNGAQAGASAPDHLHFQAVKIDDIPLLNIAVTQHQFPSPQIMRSDEIGILHPALFYSGIGDNANFKFSDKDLLNLFVWQRKDGNIQQIYFPRLRHRHFSYPEPTISPGALDVAGIVITVRQKDFETVTPEDLNEIFHQTCTSPQS